MMSTELSCFTCCCTSTDVAIKQVNSVLENMFSSPTSSPSLHGYVSLLSQSWDVGFCVQVYWLVVSPVNNLTFTIIQIQELETENSELKQQLQNLEEQLMIAHTPGVSAGWVQTHFTRSSVRTVEGLDSIHQSAAPAACCRFLSSIFTCNIWIINPPIWPVSESSLLHTWLVWLGNDYTQVEVLTTHPAPER